MNLCKNKTSYVKQLIAVLLAVLFIFQLFTLNAFAADGECGDGLTWSLENGVLTISGKGDMTDFRDGAFAPWFESAAEIRSVVLPDGLTHIGALAFYGCSLLREVRIPDSVTSIGSYAFTECTSLLTADLPPHLERIGEAAFRECEQLRSVRFPDTLRVISSMAFYRCYSLMSVSIPSSVTDMGTQVFSYCTGLVRAAVKANIQTLPTWTFYGCTKLSDVILSADITAVGEYSLQNCPALTGVYTESSDTDALHNLQQSVADGNPDLSQAIVADYDPPKSSNSTVDDGSSVISTEVNDSKNSVITVTDTSPYAPSQGGKPVTDIDAVIENSDGWKELAQIVDKKLEGGFDDKLSVSVMTDDNTVSGDDLSSLAGKNIDLTVTSSDGTVWQVDMSKTTVDDFKGKHDFGVTVSIADAEKIKIGSTEVYRIKFAGSTDFNSTVGVRLGLASAYQTATLFQKKTFGGYTKLQSVKVDADGIAWFMLANTDKGTDYYIGINCDGISEDEAIIPSSLNSNYGLPDGPVFLGVDGTRYAITGRKSSWGVDLKTVMFILLAAMIVSGGVVGLVMVLINRRKNAQKRLAAASGKDITVEDEKIARKSSLKSAREQRRRPMADKKKKTDGKQNKE